MADPPKVTGNEENPPSRFSKFWNGLDSGLLRTINSGLSFLSQPKGENANITQGADAIGDILQQIPGLGKFASVAGITGKLMNGILGTTDGMTTQDAILNSSYLAPLGLINNAFGHRANSFTMDNEAFSQVGGSYGGSMSLAEEAVNLANKKYGLLSGGALNSANRKIREATLQQNTISTIADNSLLGQQLQASLSNVYDNRRNNRLLGNPFMTQIGKQGLKIKQIVSQYRVYKLQQGQAIKQANNLNKKATPYDMFLKSLPKNLQDTSNYRMREYWEYNDKPVNFDEALSRNMFTLENDGLYHAYSVARNPSTGILEFMKLPNHPNIQDEIDWYNDNPDFQEQWELITNDGPFYYYRPKEYIFKLAPDVYKFQIGGSFNVIPEGALHARKHNMDIDGITNKGIPVVSISEGGEIQQQAEIEREEIIYRLEVTQELERLYNIYYSQDSSKEEKDEAALQAGKLLVQETLYNTIDNTNKMI